MTVLEAFLYPVVILSGIAIGAFVLVVAIGASIHLVDKISGSIK
jgi:hypothetical protein